MEPVTSPIYLPPRIFLELEPWMINAVGDSKKFHRSGTEEKYMSRDAILGQIAVTGRMGYPKYFLRREHGNPDRRMPQYEYEYSRFYPEGKYTGRTGKDAYHDPDCPNQDNKAAEYIALYELEKSSADFYTFTGKEIQNHPWEDGVIVTINSVILRTDLLKLRDQLKWNIQYKDGKPRRTPDKEPWRYARVSHLFAKLDKRVPYFEGHA